MVGKQLGCKAQSGYYLEHPSQPSVQKYEKKRMHRAQTYLKNELGGATNIAL
jgi:hypothetical protein